MREFKTSDAYRPTGDQPTALATLAENVWKPEVRRLVDNLWSRLGGDAEFAVERRS